MIADMPFPAHFATKTVPLKFMGTDLSFKLSHALFSGFKIDDGTMLLLKTLAQQKAIPNTGRVLDSGCGVGPLAVALAKRFPGLELHANDRLALACAFTTENARCNGVSLRVTPGLLMESPDGPFDLIVSNLPAKAGAPVLADALAKAANLLTPQGRVAIVIVAPLAEWARSTLDDLGAEILWQEDSHDYRVIHYRGGMAELGTINIGNIGLSGGFPGTYRRETMAWDSPVGPLQQLTYWGLPNFDSLDYRLQVAMDLFPTAAWKTPSLIWEPGQGHAASALAKATQMAPTLAGNDWLAIRAASANLEAQGFPKSAEFGVASIGQLSALPAGSFGSAIINLHTEPKIQWTAETRETLNHVLQAGGQVMITGTSTDLARFLENHKGLKVLRDNKFRGWRAVLFEKLKTG